MVNDYVASSRRQSAALDAQAEAERRTREQSLMDMYGDRTSLADLERASELYAAAHSEGRKE